VTSVILPAVDAVAFQPELAVVVILGGGASNVGNPTGTVPILTTGGTAVAVIVKIARDDTLLGTKARLEDSPELKLLGIGERLLNPTAGGIGLTAVVMVARFPTGIVCSGRGERATLAIVVAADALELGSVLVPEELGMTIGDNVDIIVPSAVAVLEDTSAGVV
jgi:hypothetical protein